MIDPALIARIRSWMFDDALPFWADAGLDRIHGGVVESMALDGSGPSGVTFKRSRVVCRQLYVFSHAELLGWRPARAAADHVFAFYAAHCWRGGTHGLARRLTIEGAVSDPTPDLYDYAFALFGLGWRYKATKDPQALRLAHDAMDVIDASLRHPSGAGFHAALPPALPRQQNPHMHLLEAALVLAEASGDARFSSLADEIATLFKTRLCRLPEGLLIEFFDDSLRPMPGDEGRWIEPGHMFEWAWILAQHQKLSGADNQAFVAALVDWAERHGVNASTQSTWNGVRDDGVALDRRSRTWPNTERIKGWIGLAELTGVNPRRAVEGSARRLLDFYLSPAPRGCWIDQRDADGNPDVETIPTSTLYHVFLAFAEALRFADSRA
jgi:mannose/cellobiose epimerase-like protein (N-acyl-D-glucosamine 2-epimerase family)